MCYHQRAGGNGTSMCEKCVADDRRIASYEALSRVVLDRAALNGIAELISKGIPQRPEEILIRNIRN